MPIGEVILGAFLSVLFDRLTSPELLQFATREGIRTKLNKWERTLKMIDALLADAEEKQLTERAVKMWLDDLQDLAYDVEDILDEFAYEALRRHLTVQDGASTSKVRNLIPACFTGCTSSAVEKNISMKSKIDAVTSRLEELCERRNALGLLTTSGGTSTAVRRRPDSTCVQSEPAVCGREEDRAKLLKMVMSDEPSDANFRVISIVGMGGLGKTTLARQVFNHDSLKRFNPKAWVCVSEDFDVFKISKALLESITSRSSHLKNLNEVQVQLKIELAGKKFFLVLDDVWSEDYGLWESLRSPFLAGAPGSTMIVTTRSEKVALTMGESDYCYNLKLLTGEACWEIFKTHVSRNRVFAASGNLTLIHQKVVERCGGLPLAVRTLGGLLRTRQTENEWEKILNSKIWVSSNSDGIIPVLKLSYYHLPSHLKRCFAYCAIFPKDYEFVDMDLVLLWLAEGLIGQLENNQLELEDVGKEYFRELLSRSIFQQSNSDESKFVMHDLVNDLAQSISKDTSLVLEDKSSVHLKIERIRHSSYIRRQFEVEKKFEDFHKMEHLRTFLPLGTGWLSNSTTYIPQTIFSDLLSKLKKLRVLSFAYYCIIELPDSIGDLIHLRYLDLSYTWIWSLPESISLLYNLQILKLRSCCFLKNLPSNMKDMINLRYLDISESSLIRKMPLEMGKLKYLRMLSNFIVGKDSRSHLKELRELKFLSGKLVISSLENMVHSQDTRETILSNKEDLEVLVLEWDSISVISKNVIVEENILNMLQPHKNLKELTIKNYGGKKFPIWIEDQSFSKMVVLQLDGCENCTTLPSFVLLSSLKYLNIKNMKNLKRIGFEMYGRDYSKSLQSLEILCFEDLPEWEHWDPMEENGHIEKFPHLQELFILNCSKFSGRLPKCLPLLKELVIDKCDELVVSFSRLPHYNFTSLKRLRLEQLPNLVQLPDGFFSLPSRIEIICCSALTSLHEGLMHRNPCLEHLEVSGCASLTFIVRGKLPSSLKKLDIRDCTNLLCVLDGKEDALNTLSPFSSSSMVHKEDLGKTSTSLHMVIKTCPSLTCLSSVDLPLPATLAGLEIYNCSNLESLSSRGQLSKALKTLAIQSCPKLESIAERFDDNTSLESIYISGCENLKSIPEGLHTLSSLRQITISWCQSLPRFPEGGLPNTTNLSISIRECEKLQALPNGVHNLSSLEVININKCAPFRDEDFPSSLTSLTSGNLNFCRHLKDWDFLKFTSLKNLEIYGCLDASFPQANMGMKLPSSLTTLKIQDSPKLEYLSSEGFRYVSSLNSLMISNCLNLMSLPSLSSSLKSLGIGSCPKVTSLPSLPSSLKKLRIQDCPKVTSLPSLPPSLVELWIQECPKVTSLSSLPSSLEDLYIQDCPKVTSLPSLPSFLLELKINKCPKLKKQCKKDKGQEWSKIAHIPCVKIDGKFIYGPEEEE